MADCDIIVAFFLTLLGRALRPAGAAGGRNPSPGGTARRGGGTQHGLRRPHNLLLALRLDEQNERVAAIENAANANNL